MLVVTGVALGVTGGPAFYDLIIPGALVWVGLHWIGSQPLPRVSWRLMLIGLGVALFISTAAGLRWSGWAGLADGLAAWLAGWRVPRDGTSAVGLLALYEPYLLLLAIVGLIMLLRLPNALTVARWPIVVWPLLVLVSCALRPGSTPLSLSASILPIALLGGHAVEVLAGGVRPVSWRWIGLHALLSFVFWIPGLLALAQHASGLAVVDQTGLILLGAGILLGLQALLLFLFLLPLHADEVWRSALLGTAAIFLILQISFATNLAYVRVDSPAEPAVGAATSPDLEQLGVTLQDLAVRYGLRQDALQVILLEGDAELTTVLRWQLRDFAQVTPSTIWPDNPQAVVVAPEAAPISGAGATEAWKGMPFTGTSVYAGPIPRCEQLAPPRCSDGLRWYLYRATAYPLTSKNVILWQAGIH